MSSKYCMLAECKDRLAEVHRRKEYLLGLLRGRDILGIDMPGILKNLRDLSVMEEELEDAIPPAEISKSKKRRQRRRKLLR